MRFTKSDLRFLHAVGIATEPEPGPSPSEWDETCDWIQRAGLPVTAENWMNLQFAGRPPTPPFDGELLAELPQWVRRALDPQDEEDDEDDDSICDAPSSGWCGEPSHTPADPDEDEEE